MESQKRVSTYYPRFLHRHNIKLDDIFEREFDSYEDAETYFLWETPLEDFEGYLDKMFAKMSDHLKEKFLNLYNNQFLSVSELQELAANPLVTIASHAHHHVVFHDQQNEESLKNEINTSFAKFSEWGIAAPKSFCFPNGEYSAKTLMLLTDLGIESAFTATSGLSDENTTPLEIPRFWLSKSKRMLTVLALLCMGPFFIKIINKLRN